MGAQAEPELPADPDGLNPGQGYAPFPPGLYRSGTEGPPRSSPIVPARPRYVRPRATPTWDYTWHFLSLRIVASSNRTQKGKFSLSLSFPQISHKMRVSCAPRRAPPRRPEKPFYSWSFVGILLMALVLLLPTSSGRGLEGLRSGGNWSGSWMRPAGAEGGGCCAWWVR